MTCNHKWVKIIIPNASWERCPLKAETRCSKCGEVHKEPPAHIHIEDLAPTGEPDEYQWGKSYDGMPVVTEK